MLSENIWQASNQYEKKHTLDMFNLYNNFWLCCTDGNI